MQRISIFFVLVMLVFLVSSCSRRPPGMPDVYPCTITVMNGGVPLDGASVFMYRDDGNGTLRISGLTDKAGKATITTSMLDYSAVGAPAGRYRIVLHKLPLFPEEGPVDISKLSEAELGKRHQKQVEFEARNQIIPTSMTQPDTTPFECVVEERVGGTAEIDMAKKTR